MIKKFAVLVFVVLALVGCASTNVVEASPTPLPPATPEIVNKDTENKIIVQAHATGCLGCQTFSVRLFLSGETCDLMIANHPSQQNPILYFTPEICSILEDNQGVIWDTQKAEAILRVGVEDVESFPVFFYTVTEGIIPYQPIK